jgi:putative membrane protein insertion efficiency factor
MPALRKCLTNPKHWLLGLALLALLALVDSFRAPDNQATAWLYVRAVRQYQYWISPHLQGHVQCRYVPTCSEYSIQAVEQHGIRYGLVLTVTRISSCRGHVPLGTEDPVPDLD